MWSEPGTVRVLIANWVEPDGDGSTIVSEARVSPSTAAPRCGCARCGW